jgi:N-acyl-D-aspartate/D-glutamate deacylase
MDADLVVFDLATVQDRSTYVGMRHVLVNDVFVVRDGELEVKAFQGKPVRRTKLVKEIQSCLQLLTN